MLTEHLACYPNYQLDEPLAEGLGNNLILPRQTQYHGRLVLLEWRAIERKKERLRLMSHSRPPAALHPDSFNAELFFNYSAPPAQRPCLYETVDTLRPVDDNALYS